MNIFKIIKILSEVEKMAATLEQLQTDFNLFKTDFASFVTNVQSALKQLSSVQVGTLNAEQQAIADNIDQAVQLMDSAMKSISFPGN